MFTHLQRQELQAFNQALYDSFFYEEDVKARKSERESQRKLVFQRVDKAYKKLLKSFNQDVGRFYKLLILIIDGSNSSEQSEEFSKLSDAGKLSYVLQVIVRDFLTFAQKINPKLLPEFPFSKSVYSGSAYKELRAINLIIIEQEQKKKPKLSVVQQQQQAALKAANEAGLRDISAIDKSAEHRAKEETFANLLAEFRLRLVSFLYEQKNESKNRELLGQAYVEARDFVLPQGISGNRFYGQKSFFEEMFQSMPMTEGE